MACECLCRCFEIPAIKDYVNILGISNYRFIDLRDPNLDGVTADHRVRNPVLTEGGDNSSQPILHFVHGSFNPVPESITCVLDFHHEAILVHCMFPVQV